MSHFKANQKSLESTKKLLLDVIDCPSEFMDNEILKIALKTQKGLAKYEDNEKGIRSCCLNTQISHAKLFLARGFVELDEARINAGLALEKVGKRKNGPNRRTKPGLFIMVNELEADVAILEKRNVLLSIVIEKMKGDLKRFAERSDDSTLLIEYEDKNKAIEAMLSYTLDGEIM